MSPKVGGVYKVSYKGVTYPNFKVERIARLRNGCVLAYGYRNEEDRKANGKMLGIPVTIYAVWEKQ